MIRVCTDTKALLCTMPVAENQPQSPFFLFVRVTGLEANAIEIETRDFSFRVASLTKKLSSLIKPTQKFRVHYFIVINLFVILYINSVPFFGGFLHF